jgi:hypothetical protein
MTQNEFQALMEIVHRLRPARVLCRADFFEEVWKRALAPGRLTGASVLFGGVTYINQEYVEPKGTLDLTGPEPRMK